MYSLDGVSLLHLCSLTHTITSVSAFDPLDLDIDVTPARVLGCLEEEAWFDALLMALRLNEGAVLFLFVLIFLLLACLYPRILTRCSRCFEHRFFFSRFFFPPAY